MSQPSKNNKGPSSFFDKIRPKCKGIHPRVVGYKCPHCGAGHPKQQIKQPIRIIGTPRPPISIKPAVINA